MRHVVLDMNMVKSEEEIHTFFKEQMNFPESYEGNLDVLSDCLTELTENICVELLLCSLKDSPVYEYGIKMKRVMEDAAQTVHYNDDGGMFAVFADINPLDGGAMW